MEEVGKAFKSIFDKLSDFFDILDLSFFVSGVALTLSILFWLNQRDLCTFQEIQFNGILIVYILICYIDGMIAFCIRQMDSHGDVGKHKVKTIQKKWPV